VSTALCLSVYSVFVTRVFAIYCSLASEVLRVVNEEIYSRPQIYKQGAR
jgi:hypothetical protein